LDVEKLKELLHNEIGKEKISYNNRQRLVDRLVPQIQSLAEAEVEVKA
jgi:hypothetical protein